MREPHTLHCFCQSVEIFQIMPHALQITHPTYIVEDINDDQDAHTQVNLQEEPLLQCIARLHPSEFGIWILRTRIGECAYIALLFGVQLVVMCRHRGRILC